MTKRTPSGEDELSRRLKAMRPDNKPGFFKKLLGVSDESTAGAADADLNYEHTQELHLLELENSALREQLRTLNSNAGSDIEYSLKQKAEAFDKMLEPVLKMLASLAVLAEVEEKLSIRRTLAELENELKPAVDNFQRIKVYRSYLENLKNFSMLTETIENFLTDSERIKDMQAASELINSITKSAQTEIDLEGFFNGEFKELKNWAAGLDSILKKVLSSNGSL